MKKRLRKLLSLIMVTAMGVVLLSGCGVKDVSEPESSASVEASDAGSEATDGENAGEITKGTEGEITIYTAFEDDQIDKYLQSFYEQYPNIKVNVIRESTGTLAAKVIAEKDAPVADVIWGTAASAILGLESYDLIKGYTPVGIEELDPKFYDTVNADAHWTGCDVLETAFLVNTELCEQMNIPVPHSFEELLDPMYEGLIVMPDPTSSGTGMLTVNGLLSMKGDAAWDYMNELNNNIECYTTSGSKPAKMAAAGECVIGISFGYRCSTLLADGNPVEVVFPTEGCGWDVEANCLINKPEINPCAYTFLDWAISDAAMSQYATEYPITGRGIIGEIPVGYSETPLENLCELDLTQAALDRDAVIKKFSPLLAGKEAQ